MKISSTIYQHWRDVTKYEIEVGANVLENPISEISEVNVQV